VKREESRLQEGKAKEPENEKRANREMKGEE
jgi:hypothetical protein